MMKIEDDYRLYTSITGKPIPFTPCKYKGKGFLSPLLLVLHFTTNSNYKYTVEYFRDNPAKTSIHVVIGRGKNEVIQMLKFDEIGYHVGNSKWQTISNCNPIAIGIELVNCGPLTKVNDPLNTDFKDMWENIIPNQDVFHIAHPRKPELKHWHKYTPQQLKSLKDVVRAIVDKYPDIQIVTHEQIDPDNKVDTGPAFPFNRFMGCIYPGNKFNLS